jgi:hypothetical protein
MHEEKTLKQWLETTWKLLIRPGDFFGNLTPDGELGPPITYMAVCSAVAALLAAFNAHHQPWAAAFLGFVNGFLTPFFLTLLLHGVTMAICRNAFTYRSLLKITAYAQVTLLFSWLPGIGWVAGLWRFYLIGLGMVRWGRIAPTKAASAILGAAAIFMVLYRVIRPMLGA